MVISEVLKDTYISRQILRRIQTAIKSNKLQKYNTVNKKNNENPVRIYDCNSFVK